MTKIINSIRKRFTQIPNAIVTDTSLSDGAYRVFSYMSTRPDDWQFNNRDIQHKLNIKRAETIAKYWKELINSGWINRNPIFNDNGKPTGYFDYILNFEPQIPTTQNAEVVSPPTTNKPYMVNQQLRKNRTYNNKDVITNKEITNTPYIPHSDNSNNELGVIGIWLEHIADIGLSFTVDEISAISEFAKYKAESGQSITSQQIKLVLQNLDAHKKSGYDICRMIRHSIASGYKGVMTPTKDFLINGGNKPIVRTGRYPSSEYITPENQAQKYDLRNYLERCYMRDMVDPRTGIALTDSQKSLFNAHYLRCKSMSISITDYIYRNEVMTGICLLDQPLNGADAISKPVFI